MTYYTKPFLALVEKQVAKLSQGLCDRSIALCATVTLWFIPILATWSAVQLMGMTRASRCISIWGKPTKDIMEIALSLEFDFCLSLNGMFVEFDSFIFFLHLSKMGLIYHCTIVVLGICLEFFQPAKGRFSGASCLTSPTKTRPTKTAVMTCNLYHLVLSQLQKWVNSSQLLGIGPWLVCLGGNHVFFFASEGLWGEAFQVWLLLTNVCCFFLCVWGKNNNHLDLRPSCRNLRSIKNWNQARLVGTSSLEIPKTMNHGAIHPKIPRKSVERCCSM